MPRFEPSLSTALEILPRVLLEHVYVPPQVDQSRLTKESRGLLLAIQLMRDDGHSESSAQALLDSLGRRVPDPDAHYETTLASWWEGKLFLQNARVLCLTTDPAIDPMWGHYGDQGRGCVLGFRHVPERSTALLEAKKVTYGDEQFIVGSALDFLLYGESPELLERTRLGVVCTKRRSWEYEQEWRCVTWRSGEGDALFGDYPFLPEELDSITFGVRTVGDDQSRMLELMRAMYPAASHWHMRVKGGVLVREPLPA